MSIGEVRAANAWIDRCVSATTASRLLGWHISTVVRRCQAGRWECQRFGARWEIDRAAVEQVRDQLEDERRRFIRVPTAERHWASLNRGAEALAAEAGLPADWSIRGLARRGLVELHTAVLGHEIVERDQVLRAGAEWQAAPPPCPGCGRPLPPGRDNHGIECYCQSPAAREASRRGATGRKTREAFRHQAYRDGFVALGVHELAEQVSARLALAGDSRSPSRVWKVARRLRVGELSHGVWMYTAADVAAVADAIKSADNWMARRHRNVDFRRRWYEHRFGSTAFHGRLAKAIASAKGRRVGRPKGKQALALEERAEIQRLHNRISPATGKRYSQQQIANTVGVSREQVRRALGLR